MIKYYPKNRKNPTTGVAKYYATIAPVDPCDIDDVIADIENRCTINRADVYACLEALQTVMSEYLTNGNSVHLHGMLGCFRVTISSQGSDTAQEVTADNIKRVRIRYRPSVSLKKALSAVKFEKYVEAKSDE